MHNCSDCGKNFPFASKLLRHLNRKIPCSSNTFSENTFSYNKNVYENDKKVYHFSSKKISNDKKVYENDKKVNVQEEKVSCDKCEKVLKNKRNLQKHQKTCKGVHVLQCPTCLKKFSSRASKYQHIKNVKCSPPEEEIDLKEENKALREKVAILEATKGNTVTNNTTNNNNNYVTNYTIKYEVKYNPETRCLTTDDPKAPFSELLCFNGFKHEAAKSKLKYIDQGQLQEHIDNVRTRKDYYNLYTFFFRNVDNSRLHMFTMGKNNNATHAQVFNNGSLEKMEKSQLFENVSKYIGQYLLNMSIDNIDVINMVLSDQASKNAFLEVTKDNSQAFNYFKSNGSGGCLRFDFPDSVLKNSLL